MGRIIGKQYQMYGVILDVVKFCNAHDDLDEVWVYYRPESDKFAMYDGPINDKTEFFIGNFRGDDENILALQEACHKRWKEDLKVV